MDLREVLNSNSLRKSPEFKEIFDNLHSNDLIFLINGEFEVDGNFVLLCESTKDGEISIDVEGEVFLFQLKSYEPTPLKIKFDFGEKDVINYKYRFLSSSGEGKFFTKYSDETDYAVISCNDPTRKINNRPNLFESVKDVQVRFFLGDQIYGDIAFFSEIISDEAYNKVFEINPGTKIRKFAPIIYQVVYGLSFWNDRLTDDEIFQRYSELYRLFFWKEQEFLRTGMNLFMPDDHDFYDACGSVYDDLDDIRLRVVKAGYRVFDRYQMGTRINQNSAVYFSKVLGETLYIGVDTRVDRFSKKMKNHIFENSFNYEERPTWISPEQTNWVKNLLEKNKFKKIIVSLSTSINPGSEFAIKKTTKFVSDSLEYYSNPRSRVEFEEFFRMFFDLNANVVFITGDVHKCNINDFKFKNKKIFELTSSAISRTARGDEDSANFGMLLFFDTWLFKSSNFDGIKQKYELVSLGNNVLKFTFSEKEIKGRIFCFTPLSYLGALLQKFGLKKEDNKLREIDFERKF
jgi:hypothetical protein